MKEYIYMLCSKIIRDKVEPERKLREDFFSYFCKYNEKSTQNSYLDDFRAHGSQNHH